MCLGQLLEKRLRLWDLSLALSLGFFACIHFLEIDLLKFWNSRTLGSRAWIRIALQTELVLFVLLRSHHSTLGWRDIKLWCLLLHTAVWFSRLVYILVGLRYLSGLYVFLVFKIFQQHIFFLFFEALKELCLVKLVFLIHSCLVWIDCMFERLLLRSLFLFGARQWFRWSNAVALVECLWVDAWPRSLFYSILTSHIHWVRQLITGHGCLLYSVSPSYLTLL